MKEISIHTFKKIIDSEKTNPAIDFINVCTPAEYTEKHIAGVRSMPLDEIPNRLEEFNGKKTIYVHCRSGKRGRSAIEKLKSLGITAELVNVEGGLLAWDEAGFETQSFSTRRIPLMRQVLLTAGLIIVLSHIGAHLFHPAVIYISLFVGLGLTFSGATGWCGMAYILGKLPWNKK